MKFKMLLSTAIATAAIATAFSANATPVFPVFTVNPGVGEQGSAGAFQANDLGGQYNEVVTFTTATQFNVSLIFIGGQFTLDDTTNPVVYNGGQSGLGNNYGLYATFLGSGTYSTAGGTTTFNLTAGNLSLALDKDNNTTYTPPANGSIAYSLLNAGDDILLATGTNTTGTGTSLGNNCGNNNCGSFGQTTPLALTGAGSSFFPVPNPFYNLALTSGQFQGINPVVGTSVTSFGTANTVFKIPEPSPLALLGLGLVALGLTRRRSGKAKA